MSSREEGGSKDDLRYFVNSTAVKELTPADFVSSRPFALKDKRCTMLMVYADWCPHCKAMIGTWEELGNTLMCVNVAAFDVAKYQGHYDKILRDLPSFPKTFPTILIYKEGRGEDRGTSVPSEHFEGERTLGNLIAAATRECGKCS